MATVGDALTYLVRQASGLSEANRAEYLAAIDAEYPVATPAADSAPLSQAEADVAAAEAALAEAKAAAANGAVN